MQPFLYTTISCRLYHLVRFSPICAFFLPYIMQSDSYGKYPDVQVRRLPSGPVTQKCRTHFHPCVRHCRSATAAPPFSLFLFLHVFIHFAHKLEKCMPTDGFSAIPPAGIHPQLSPAFHPKIPCQTGTAFPEPLCIP